MSRLDRRHDKLLREYLAARRDRTDAEAAGASPAHLERLTVRERALAGTLRRIRLQLGLPEGFDAHHEAVRLGAATDRGARRAHPLERRAPPLFTDRQRVNPVPVPPVGGRQAARIDVDLTGELVTHSARYCGRRAADEVLARRAALAPTDRSTSLGAWPERPLARITADVPAGAAGGLMGELLARAVDDPASQAMAAIAIRCYVDEFTSTIVAALLRERDALAPEHRPDESETFGQLPRLRRELAQASYERLVAEVRALRPGVDITAADLADAAAE